MTSKHNPLASFAFALSVALVTPLVSAETPVHSGGSTQHDHSSHHAAMPASDMDMKMKAMTKNHDTMASVTMTGNPDIDFALMMRNHHQAGIKMAEAELRDGKEPKMRTMAKAIIAAQKKEIAQLDLFLAKHGQSADHKHGHTH